MRRTQFGRSLLALALATIGMGACSFFPGFGGPLPRGGATYQGYLHMDGQDLWTTVRLAPSGEDVAGELLIRDGPSAAGTGEVTGRQLFIGLEYQGECAGRIILTGEFEDGGAEIAGRVRAADCTGQMTGSFLFKVRSESADQPVDSPAGF